jgi:hypothetical protein
MANNFRYISAYNRVFCHQAHGSDANDGLTPDTPKKTLAGVRAIVTAVRNEVILSGHFKDELFGPLGIGSTLIGDGKTIIEYANNATEMFTASINELRNIELRNINKLTSSSGFIPYFNNCILRNVNISNGNAFFYGANNSEFYNCNLIPNTSSSFMVGITNNKFINCYIKLYIQYSTSMVRNYFNKATLFECTSVLTGMIGSYNNFECKFKYNSTYYDNLAAIVTAYPVLNDAEGNRNETITFNKPEYGDYTVPSNSPLLVTSNWNSNICGNAMEGSGVFWSDGVTNWTISQSGSTDDLEVVSGTLQLVSGKTVGTITRNSDSQLDIGALKTVKFAKFLGNLSFNNGVGVNAPAINAYNSGDAGYSPVRLTIQLKYSPISLTSGQWDALNWYIFDLSDGIRMDGMYGSGNPEFDLNMPAHLGNIKARYYLVKITLRSAL